MSTSYQPDENGFYGSFGGAYIPEMLIPNIEELQENYLKIINSESSVIFIFSAGLDSNTLLPSLL